MRIKIIISFVVLLLLTTNNGQAQSEYTHTMTHPFSDTIPYEFIDNKIIVEGSINGKPAKFLFDTGAAISLFSSDAIEPYGMVPVAKGQLISDINGKQSTMKSVMVKDLRIGHNFHFEEMPAVVFPASNYYKALGVAGLIGSDIFKETTVAIQSREKRLIIYYPDSPAGLTRDMAIRMTDMMKKVPVFTIRMGNIDRKVIFDSGAYNLVSLSKDAFKAMQAVTGAKSIATAQGSYGIGISGAKKQNLQDYVRIGEFEIAGKKFRNAKSVTKDKDEVLIGIQLINHGDITIDFAKRRFYFLPFDKNIVDMESETKQRNVFLSSSLETSGETVIIVSGTIGDIDILTGEKVWSINGIDIKDIDFTKTVIRQYIDELDGDEVVLMVGRSRNESRKVITNKI